MEIERRYKPWLACLQDDSRPIIGCAFVDRLSVEKGVMVSANGFLMTIIPVVLTPDEQTGCIHRRLLQYAWSVSKRKKPLVSITLDGEWVVMPDESRHKNHYHETKYLDWRRICPPQDQVATPDARRATLGLDPMFVQKVAQTLDMRGPVHLHFCKGASPVTITDSHFDIQPEPPFGLVMPAHLRYEDEAVKGRKVPAVTLPAAVA